ncbi:MAG TPA: penicillin-binding transpeptidase domain-containing protein [Polyangiaceae bacterium]|jgi:cell division protein FtsI/penicillin-binding protein 2
MRRSASIALAGVASLLASGVLLACHRAGTPAPPGSTDDVATPSLSHPEPTGREDEPSEAEASNVAGLDLLHVTVADGSVKAPSAAGSAELTLDADLQRTALGLLSTHHVPEAAVVLMDVASGKVLVYANHVEHGTPHDLCAEATAPSASVFKVVTAAALVEDAHLGPDTKQCYSGGEQRITAADLVDDPQRDRWCTTLGGAMGRSINTVFARLAREHLAPGQLETMARRFGYGQPFPFDVPVQPSGLHVPTEPLEFARTAAGFWNTTLSPLEAAEISAIVAREGESVRPGVVERVVAPDGRVAWSAPETAPAHRVVSREIAAQLGTMMERTVAEGTSWRAFHDGRGGVFLPGITVAGKTGTLTENETHRYYSWFTGFAPSHPQAGVRQVAVAVLLVNGPNWQVKANVVARDVLRAYFASHDAPGVTRPSLNAIARHHKR